MPRRRLWDYVPDYGPSTPPKQVGASKWIARDIALRRRRPSSSALNLVPRAGGGINWYSENKLIGTSTYEDSPVSRVKPRRLGNPRNR